MDAGDLWVIWNSFGGNATITDPRGWNLLEDVNGGSSNVNCHIRAF